ncbi:hypothetical protein BO71DRAFT_393806 [Aspergillus ellipticus CBS 707.79]|uniref:Uncharacterized protein n=1 Tax=Aspergillus ellipticus CBS 707.79 TaxID=1448320 RepID=A0A319E065_9EURO|nr:hypothetical protein BO71DRAFT_393806 [Aspergillus ellipticus CBS 707.79]
MCQACIPADNYDCDSDLEYSDNECACPHDHKAEGQGHSHEHEHEYEHKHEHGHSHQDVQKEVNDEEDDPNAQKVTFPSDPFFNRLIDATDLYKHDVIINDATYGLQLTYAQFLHDVQALRVNIQRSVPADSLNANGTFKEGAGFIGVLAEIQYPFFVASLAVLALGGVIVPMGHAPEPDQAIAVIEESKAVVLVFDPTQEELAAAVKQKQGKEAVPQLPIEINLAQKSSEKYVFGTQNLDIAATRPALLLFGGDDLPGVLKRQTFYERATASANSPQPEMTDVMMLCFLICLSSGPPPS